MMAPLQCRLEPVKGNHGAVRAVLMLEGRVVATRDAFVSKGRVSGPADYLAQFVEDHGRPDRAVEVVADWPVLTLGAYTLRARLQCALRGFLERAVA